MTLSAVLLALNALVGFTVFAAGPENKQEEDAFERMRVMMRVMQLIRQNYVDEAKADPGDLIYNALKGMVGSLDPFSSFMEPSEYHSMMEATEGQFGGLGVVVTIRDDVLTIVAPIEGTPGAKAGLLAGDQIVEIEGQTTRDFGVSDAVQRLKGEPGTRVNITIFRPETSETRQVTIERAIIEVPTVKDVRVLDHAIGYVRITQFSEPTAEKLREALKSLVGQEIRGLILDVRNNPGGLLESAVDVCSYFLPKGKLIVLTEGRRSSQKQEFKSDGGKKFPRRVPIVILVNGGSASAAEIVAGCLQDHGVAELIGEKTFGKGSVQNVIGLPDGSALRLTTAKYYTPSRRVIHENGITPDIKVEISKEEQQKLLEQQMQGDTFIIDSQLRRALENLHTYLTYRRATEGKLLELPEANPDNEQARPDAE